MTEKEKLMYRIMGQISGSDAPIVFKGGLVTKSILSERGFDKIERMTKDIDANWTAEPPAMAALADTINGTLGELGILYMAEPAREYGEHMSAGICIRDKETRDIIVSMDIDIKPLMGSRIYYAGETAFKGVLANEILADKISTMSADAVFKHRAKDIVDVFALSHCVPINAQEIFQVCRKAGREIKSFDALFGRKAEVEHAYNKLKNIAGKPDFAEVYPYLLKFAEPFAKRDNTAKVWNADRVSWQ